ncbi:hypothetical protein OG342_24890 [Streptomyces bobili]|uniref:hypothetical protein n=1 Tax=Streptomyces bobili TaxID=67280 RepID=UPI002259D60B|nr:hypothetical protein [Streptomyces bobili]MCX5526047.1 hypothetical protein [Streptomyces bobili]
MPRPALLPAAAPRIALRAALLLGGLFALGFLFGGQAQAADGATPTTVSPPGVSVNLVTPPVRERVVRPVGEALEGVSEKLTEAETETETEVRAARVTPPAGVSELPTPPPLDSLPSLPELPDAPSLPPLPSLPTPPSLPTLPVSQPALTLPTPVASDPRGSGTGGDGAVEPAVPQPSYGPQGVVSEAPVAHGGGRQRDGHAATGGHASVRGTPVGLPDGSLGSASLVDSGGSRHADAHAVTPYHRVPLLLVPGGAVRTEAAGIRDRYRDIPVFPG